MKVFVSWAKDRSRDYANTLVNELKGLLDELDFFTASRNIPPGKVWSEEILRNLHESDICILVLTRDNLENLWMHFEAGAFARSRGPLAGVSESEAQEQFYISKQNYAYCILFEELEPEVLKAPLNLFQCLKFNKEGMQRLVHELYDKLQQFQQTVGGHGGKSGPGESTQLYAEGNPVDPKKIKLDRLFEQRWPGLEASCNHIGKDATARDMYAPDKMKALWAREARAKEVWVFTPSLYHDIHNPDCTAAVMENRKRGIRYRYIILGDYKAMLNCKLYPVKYGLRMDTWQKEHRMLPVCVEGKVLNENNIRPELFLAGFFSETVLYDPHLKDRACYGYPPGSYEDFDDVVQYGKSFTDSFSEYFELLWEMLKPTELIVEKLQFDAGE